MPTYEYACKSCGEHLEVVQKFTDDALTTCPACGGSLRKVFGSIGISFKGSGFYRTDSRPAATKKDLDREKAREKAGEKAGDKAGDKAATGAKDGATGSDAGASSKSDSSSTSDTSTTKADSSSKSGSSSSKPGGDKAGAAAATG